MGKRGPAPKPTNLRLLHGDRADRINDAEPVPAAADIKIPSWLPVTARAVWRQYAPDLQSKGVLTAWDVEAFAIFCDAAARRRKAVKELREHGEVNRIPIMDAMGNVAGYRLQKSPWTLVLNEADAQVQRYGARFGLTPSDRSQLRIGGGGHRDPTEDLLT
ncbi:phage terminase small subunit P27 family [Nonomuraea sp. NPDC050310]|uniref:phage terminase small subunit P27 family n=1 Tax=Nonomuraea sp. NPDC050310 TaxID=3154935 RepID=UPI0033D026BC